jgi:hypothetical protein
MCLALSVLHSTSGPRGISKLSSNGSVSKVHDEKRYPTLSQIYD